MKNNTIILFIITLTLASCNNIVKEADMLWAENNFEAAVELYQKASDRNNAYAKWRLSIAYEYALGVEMDFDKAWKLINEASEEGCDEATINLAISYIEGFHNKCEINIDKGHEIINDLITHTKSPYVLSKYAVILYVGEYNYEADEKTAMSILTDIKDTTCYMYNYVMGRISYYKEDYDAALLYLENSYKKGSIDAAGTLAAIYQEQDNEKKTLLWEQNGISRHDAYCLVALAYYTFADDTSEQYDPEKAIELLLLARDLDSNYYSSYACYCLGNIYYDGLEGFSDAEYAIRPNRKKAFKYYNEAYERGDLDTDTHYDTEIRLGKMYAAGCGCTKDIEKGKSLLEHAAQNGIEYAADMLNILADDPDLFELVLGDW